MSVTSKNKEKENMFEDIAKDIKAQLYEKARSPLAATFIGAWLVINVRTVLVFFSDLHVDEKIAYFDAANPTIKEWVLHSLIYPFLSALTVLLVYPHLARYAYKYWQTQYIKIKEFQQQIEDKTPITQAEANALRRASIEQQLNLESQLGASAARNGELQRQLEAVKNQLTEVLTERGTLVKSLAEKDAQIISLDNHIKQNQGSKKDNKPLNDEETSPLPVGDITLPSNIVGALKSNGFSSTAIRLFTFLIKKGGDYNQNSLLSSARNSDKLDIQHAINFLKENNYVYVTNSGIIKLSNEGISLAVESGLTELFKE